MDSNYNNADVSMSLYVSHGNSCAAAAVGSGLGLRLTQLELGGELGGVLVI